MITSKSITLSKWYPCKINSYYDLINRYEVSVSQKTTDIIRLSYSQSGPALIHHRICSKLSNYISSRFFGSCCNVRYDFCNNKNDVRFIFTAVCL